MWGCLWLDVSSLKVIPRFDFPLNYDASSGLFLPGLSRLDIRGGGAENFCSYNSLYHPHDYPVLEALLVSWAKFPKSTFPFQKSADIPVTTSSSLVK